MRISVIMPVYLGEYAFGVHRSATNPSDKFIRAVSSFLAQTHSDRELIITADGCDIAEEVYYRNFSGEVTVFFNKIPKQPLYGGMTRQTGLNKATGDAICYLDHDDILGSRHLEIINENFNIRDYAWIYYDDFLIKSADHSIKEKRNVTPRRNSMGTSAICHRADIPVVWGDGNTHDFDMIEKYLLHLHYKKIPAPEYYVCHNSGLKLDF